MYDICLKYVFVDLCVKKIKIKKEKKEKKPVVMQE